MRVRLKSGIRSARNRSRRRPASPDAGVSFCGVVEASDMSNTGFSLCGFGLGAQRRGKAHRLKPVPLTAVAFGGIAPALAAKNQFDDDQCRSYGNGRIGEVERGPDVTSKANLDEIRDSAVNQAIERVPRRAA